MSKGWFAVSSEDKCVCPSVCVCVSVYIAEENEEVCVFKTEKDERRKHINRTNHHCLCLAQSLNTNVQTMT